VVSGAGRRHLLSIADLTDDELRAVVDRSRDFAAGVRPAEALRGATVGIYFRKTSTRTRTAFSVGATRLGAQIVTYGAGDLQVNTGETVADTGRVLSLMLDGLVARTASELAELRTYAGQDRMAVINAMTEEEHPTQTITDLSTLLTVFGRLTGLRVLYVGEGNNTAAPLAMALARVPGVQLYLRTPPGYGVRKDRMDIAIEDASRCGALIEERHDLDELPTEIDVVYTTRWQTTGTAKSDPDWRDVFVPFQVDEALMGRYPAALFMHDLPAHRGDEVTAGVLDGPRSIAFQQAEHKLFGAMAVLEWCLADGSSRST
jgi:ornithine carbamoyltransferase